MSIIGNAKRDYLSMLSDRKSAFEDEKDRLISEDEVLLKIKREIDLMFLDELKGKYTHAEAEEKSAELQKKLERAAAERGLSDKVLDYVPLCPVCGDTGYVNGKQCRCLTAYILKKCSGEETGSGTAYALDDFDPGIYSREEDRLRAERIKAGIAAYLDGFDSDHSNIALVGVSGSGKTLLSYIVCSELIKSGKTVMHMRAQDLVQALSDDIYEDEPEDFFGMAAGCDLLVIDDLGTERQTDFVQNLLFELFDERYRRGKATMITTNLSAERQKELYSDRIFSRFYSKSRTNFRMPDEDIRLKLAKKGASKQ